MPQHRADPKRPKHALCSSPPWLEHCVHASAPSEDGSERSAFALSAVVQLPKLLELVGLGYSAWFVYRYLLFKVSAQHAGHDLDNLNAAYCICLQNAPSELETMGCAVSCARVLLVDMVVLTGAVKCL